MLISSRQHDGVDDVDDELARCSPGSSLIVTELHGSRRSATTSPRSPARLPLCGLVGGGGSGSGGGGGGGGLVRWRAGSCWDDDTAAWSTA